MDGDRRILFCVSTDEVSTNVNSDDDYGETVAKHACTCMLKRAVGPNLTGMDQRGHL